MKRTLAALAMLCVANSTQARIPSSNNLADKFFVGATGFYLQNASSNGEFDYGSRGVLNISQNSFTGIVDNFSPGYDWGWGAQIGYIAKNGVNDIALRYSHIRNDAVDSDASVDAIFPIINGDPTNIFGSAVTGSFSTHVDQIDLVGGQFIPVQSCLIFHPFIGLRWAQLKEEFYTTITHPSGTVIFENFESKYNGIGPNMGLSANYFMTPQFSLVGYLGAALLFGDIDASSTFFDNEINLGLHETNAKNTNHRLVPMVDMKLGFDYTTFVDIYLLNIELGWKFTEYFNVLDTVASSPANTGGFPANAGIFPISTTTSDLSLQGPYVEFVLAF